MYKWCTVYGPEKLCLEEDPPWIHQQKVALHKIWKQFLLIVRYISLSKIKLKVKFLELRNCLKKSEFILKKIKSRYLPSFVSWTKLFRAKHQVAFIKSEIISRSLIFSNFFKTKDWFIYYFRINFQRSCQQKHSGCNVWF